MPCRIDGRRAGRMPKSHLPQARRLSVSKKNRYLIWVLQIETPERKVDMNFAAVSNGSIHTDPKCQIPRPPVAASLMHRIRNPLSVIIVAASQLQEDEALPGQEDSSLVRTILMAAEQIEDILRRYSQYACPEPPAYESIDINQLCRAEIDRVRNDSAAGRTMAKFDFSADDDIGEIAGDDILIRIALAELIDNAIEAIEKGGTVTLKTRLDDHGAVIVIEDTGSGIPEALTEKVWQPFFTTRPGKAGLGLPIAGRIIAAHNGRIDLEPRPGGGIQVTLTLPYTNHNQE